MWLIFSVAAVVFAVSASNPTLAQSGGEMTPEQQIAEGEAIFRLYCSPCHGVDARGGGPVAADLKTEPPSLRDITKRRNNVFDAREITAFIDGRDMPRAHGTPEMPIWGNLFRYVAEVSDALASDQEAIERRAQERISLIVKYLESIQEK